MEQERLGSWVGYTGAISVLCIVHTSTALEMGMWLAAELLTAPTNPQWAGGKRKARKLGDKDKTITKKLFSKCEKREENK